MNGGQRRLITAALLLTSSGILLGFAQAALTRYQTMPVVLYRAHWKAATLARRGNPEELTQAAEDKGYTYVRIVDAHTHLIKVATLLLLAALVYPVVSLPEKRKRMLALMFITGNCAFPLGVLSEIYTHGHSAQAVAATGAMLILLAFAGVLWGLLLDPTVRDQRP